MKLNIIDRLNIVHAILPKQNTFEKMLMTRDIKKKLDLLPEENKLISFKVLDDGKVQFDTDIALKQVKTVDISDAEMNLLNESVIALKDKVTLNLLDTIQVIKNENKPK